MRGERREVRGRAALAVASLRAVDSVVALRPVLDDPEAQVRRDVAFALGRVGDPATAGALSGALSAERDATVRSRLIEALGHMGTAEAADALLAADVPPREEADRTRALAVLGGVYGVRHEGLRGHLIENLTHEDSSVRLAASSYFSLASGIDFWATRALFLRQALDTYTLEDPAAMHLVLGLGRLHDFLDGERLRHWATEAGDWRTRSNAIAGLDPLTTSAQVLVDALDDPSPQVSFSAVRVLTKDALDQALVPHIEQWIETNPDRLQRVRELMIQLAQMDRIDAIVTWVDATEPGDDRRWAVGLEVLSYMPGEEAVTRIARAARDPSERTATAAAAALLRRWMGDRRVPGVEEVAADLGTGVGAAVTPLVLGRTRAGLTKDAVWLPIRLDVGVFDWLTVGTTVPFSRRRAEFATSFQADGANVGSLPATAGDFLGSVSAANNALSVIVTTLCTSNPSSPECSQASVLLAEGQAFHGALTDGADYGLFPLEGSVTGDALQSRTTSLLNAYQAVGVPSFPTAIPLATELLSEATYLDLVTNPALLGVGGVSLKTWRSPWELGDVEIHAYARLWGIGLETDPNEPRPAIRLEIGAGALIRIGTGRTDSPRNFIDTGSGDGQYDFELSGFGTLSVGRRVGVVAEVRYGIQRPVDVLRRIKAPDRIFAPLDPAEQVVRWNPGDYMQIRVSPRFYLTEEVAVAFDLRYFRKKSDRYSSVGGAVGPDPTVLELETKERSLGVGVGVVFSTVQSGLGRPLEVRFLVQEAVSGSGGATPKTWRLEVGLRLFWGLWGQDQAEGREN